MLPNKRPSGILDDRIFLKTLPFVHSPNVNEFRSGWEAFCTATVAFIIISTPSQHTRESRLASDSILSWWALLQMIQGQGVDQLHFLSDVKWRINSGKTTNRTSSQSHISLRSSPPSFPWYTISLLANGLSNQISAQKKLKSEKANQFGDTSRVNKYNASAASTCVVWLVEAVTMVK